MRLGLVERSDPKRHVAENLHENATQSELPAPEDPDQSFRLIPIAVSDRSRSPIPGDPDQRREPVEFRDFVVG